MRVEGLRHVRQLHERLAVRGRLHRAEDLVLANVAAADHESELGVDRRGHEPLWPRQPS